MPLFFNRSQWHSVVLFHIVHTAQFLNRIFIYMLFPIIYTRKVILKQNVSYEGAIIFHYTICSFFHYNCVFRLESHFVERHEHIEVTLVDE